MNSDTNTKAAFLWDESFLWGLMAYKALNQLELPFDLLKAEDISKGLLKEYSMLFVPGGWASNKSKALGEEGIKAIQDFVAKGGNYLGFCGGAGLATKAKGCLGLLDVKRRPTKDRVPSFSGRIHLDLNPHIIWNTQSPPDARHGTSVFTAWWPSQFIIEDNDVKVLATYGDAMPDAFSSDLNVKDVGKAGDWSALEETYGINLNPARLRGEPAVLEGSYGKGKVIVSLVHFDTPEDFNGQQVLVNLWKHLAGYPLKEMKSTTEDSKSSVDTEGNIHKSPLLKTCSDLISLGQRNFLWFWRNSMLLQWKRGVRGLEYNTLYIMVKEILKQTTEHSQATEEETLQKMTILLSQFSEKAQKLLILERHAMQKGHITYQKCDDPEINELRLDLFSASKSHGGRFKELLDEIDVVLYSLISKKRAS